MVIENIKKRGILIVDDDADVRQLIEQSFRAINFENFYSAENGRQALEKIIGNGANIYVIILDLRMPEVDGHEFILQLLKVHKYHVGIVVFTGYSTREIEKNLIGLSDDLVEINNVIDKPAFNQLLDDVQTTMENIHTKRLGHQGDLLSQFGSSIIKLELHLDNTDSKMTEIQKQLAKVHSSFFQLENKFSPLNTTLSKIYEEQTNWIKQIGMDIIRGLIIALFVFMFFQIDTSDILWKKIHNQKSISDAKVQVDEIKKLDPIDPLYMKSEVEAIINNENISTKDKLELINSIITVLSKGQ
jgi:CheY-like chemotaxis protein